jgi:hypothetical protein
VIGPAAAVVVVAVMTACALKATLTLPDEPVGAAVVEQPTPPGRSVAPHREVAARSDHVAHAEVGPGPLTQGPPGRPEWATDDLAHVELVAPEPDELPCGTTDCLRADPVRHRRETRQKLADGALTDLMAAQDIPADLEEELRAQLQANLRALE